MPKKRYVCSIVVFSPNPATSERINVGVIVGNDEEGFRGRSVKSVARARAIDDGGQLDNPNARESVLTFAGSVASMAGLTEAQLQRRIDGTGNAMSSVKLTGLLPGFHYNLDAALAFRFETHLVEPHEE